MSRARTCLASLAMLAASAAGAQQVDVSSGSVVETVRHLSAGQYVWEPEVAPSGPAFLIVNTATQRAVLFRNGVPIAASTVSSGRSGHSTPTGVFTILQKQVEHYSSKYDDAPMPYMQRLTWQGVALHAGHLPGYPASHGCIRLPAGFAKLLYGVTALGMTVVITDREVTPHIAPTPDLVAASEAGAEASTAIEWAPAKAPTGPVSIVVSVADRRAVVLRNGIAIGSAPVSVAGPVTGTWAYVFRDVDAQGQHWLRLQLSPNASGAPVPPEEWQRFSAPDQFSRDVAAIVQPGTTILVTPDSLRPDSPTSAVLQSQ